MYIQRCFTNLANKYLNYFPALSLIGPRQVGKTTFAKQLRPEWRYFDLERPKDFNLISENLDSFFEEFSCGVIIDEAQEHPKLFKALRSAIDQHRDIKGRFIITGSSSPELISHIGDSLAGRVGNINIGTFKANEYYQQELSDFYNLFKLDSHDLSNKNFTIQHPKLTSKQMRHCWLYGGYPEPMLKDEPDFFINWMNNYQDTYIQRDIAKLFPRLNKRAYQRFLSILAGISGKIINKADLSRAIEISESSIKEYLEIAESTYIWKNIYHDEKSTVKSIVKKPKGYLRDSGLLHFLQNINNMNNLLASPQCGHSFESYVIEEIIKGITASGIPNIKYSYYRTTKGAEVDFIVDCPAGRIPIEIKLSSSVKKQQLMALDKYIKDNGCHMGLLINQSDDIFWINDSILQVPVGCI